MNTHPLRIRSICAAIGIILLSQSLFKEAHASVKTLKNVSLEDQITLGSAHLKLNGLGIRQATFLKLDVYVAGLYVPEGSQDEKKILENPGPKQLQMHFMRSVSASKVRSAWEDAIDKSCPGSCEELKKNLATHNTWLTDVKDGDVMTYNFYSNRLEVLLNGKTVGTLPNGEFSKWVLSTWIDESRTLNPSLRQGLLGLDSKG